MAVVESSLTVVKARLFHLANDFGGRMNCSILLPLALNREVVLLRMPLGASQDVIMVQS